MQNCIEKNEKVRKENVNHLINDLKRLILKCNEENWKKEGRK